MSVEGIDSGVNIYEKNIITRYDQLANNMIIGYTLIPIKSLASQIYSIEKKYLKKKVNNSIVATNIPCVQDH